MRIHIKTLYLPKAGNSWGEYEDAWAWWDGANLVNGLTSYENGYMEACIFTDNNIQFAIADGATEASFKSRLWAMTLVEEFINTKKILEEPHKDDMMEWLESPIQRWHKQIPWDNLPWYAEEKARLGAFSTFLSLTLSFLSDEKKIIWRAIAVGDSCLFQIRNNDIKIKFPIIQAKEFNSSPPLISTQRDYNSSHLEFSTINGEFQPGDIFMLTSDALAAWFLEQLEADKPSWEILKDLNWEKFNKLMEKLRLEKEIRNDDVTLMLLWMEKEQIRIEITENSIEDTKCPTTTLQLAIISIVSRIQNWFSKLTN